jgi:Lrp/AsnC family transcriptional regulator for asnA, asnC and gidA
MSQSPVGGGAEGAGHTGAPLDDLDRGILHELQLDGRRSFREIARTLRTSEATVRFRVKRLRDSGVLQILGFVDPAALGYGLLASLLLRVRPDARQAVLAAVSEWPEAMYLSTTMGRVDLFVQIVCEDQAALTELLDERIPQLDGITDVETFVELRVHKARYVYGALRSERPEDDG